MNATRRQEPLMGIRCTKPNIPNYRIPVVPSVARPKTDKEAAESAPKAREKFTPVVTRKCNVITDAFGVQLVLTITTTRATKEPRVETFRYAVESLPSPFGVAFKLVCEGDHTDMTEESYELILESEADQCSCKGFQAHQKPCKHLLAVMACRRAGKL
jgi:SWIM zinc finger